MRYTGLLFMLSIIAFPFHGLAGEPDKKCEPIAGAISTNFLDQTAAFGTATGDFAGAVGVTVVSSRSNGDGSLVFVNQVHWVTGSGDTIQFALSEALAYPTAVAGLYATRYPKGSSIVGGTGRFAGATGSVNSYGALDLGQGQVVLRYSGEVCYSKSE